MNNVNMLGTIIWYLGHISSIQKPPSVLAFWICALQALKWYNNNKFLFVVNIHFLWECYVMVDFYSQQLIDRLLFNHEKRGWSRSDVCRLSMTWAYISIINIPIYQYFACIFSILIILQRAPYIKYVLNSPNFQ